MLPKMSTFGHFGNQQSMVNSLTRLSINFKKYAQNSKFHSTERILFKTGFSSKCWDLQFAQNIYFDFLIIQIETQKITHFHQNIQKSVCKQLSQRF